MTVVVLQQPRKALRVTERVTDLASFRRWAKSDDFPEQGRYSHLNGELWVDLSMERAGHNEVKNKIGSVLTLLSDENKTGRYFADRMLLTHVGAGLSTEPDGMFLSYDAQRAGSVRLRQGEDSLEVEGTPDMVLEVVSPTSLQKDTVVLRDLYWRAGVREYWLALPRGRNVVLDVLRYGPKGYVATRKDGGWLKSAVFGRSFRLTRHTDPLGQPAYTLAVR